MAQPRPAPGRSTVELIEILGRLGVRLRADGDRLRYEGPPGAVTGELRRALAERRSEVLAMLAAMRSSGAAPPAPPLERAPRSGPVPLSHGQRRLWFLQQLDPDDTSYHLWLAWHVRGRLDVAAMERAVNDLLARHEALRTRFVAQAGVPWQEVVEGWRLDLPAEPAGDLAAAGRELRAETRRPFRLDEAPPVRARLLAIGPDEHVLLLMVHHVAADGWSLGVLDAELWEGYRARRAGAGAPARAPAVQPADLVAWQRRRLEEGEEERQLGYWRERLRGAPTDLELPSDRPRGPVRRPAGGTRPFKLSPPLTAALRDLSRRQGVTLYTTLLAAFQVLLWRCTGQADLLVGTPVSGRARPELERAVGFFVNTVVVRADLRGNPSFEGLLGRVRSDVTGALAHQDLPFERLVDEMDGARDLGRTPLFQAAFAMQDVTAPRPSPGDLDVRWFTVPSDTEQFELSLHVGDAGADLRGGLGYSADLFEAATANRLLRRYRRILDEVCLDPRRRLDELGLPAAAEHRRVLEAGRGPERVGEPPSVEAEVAARVAERPHAPAVTDGERRLTYAQLWERSGRLAGELLEAGGGPDVRIGLLSERRVELVVGLLAILRAGAAYVPLDPELPPARLASMASDAGLEVAVVDRPGRSRPIAGGLREVVAEGGDRRDPGPIARAHPDSLAYLVYTSGSTGRPKGVAVSRRALAAYVRWAGETYGRGRGGGAIAHTSAGFDLTVTSLLVPLTRGEPVELVPEERGLDGLGEALAAGPRRSVLKLTPAHLEILARQVGVEEVRRRVAALVVGGEQLWWRSADGWAAGGMDVFNEYGPTEAVVGCVVHRLPAGGAAGGPVPIGRPAPGTRAYVAGGALELLGEGSTGELCLGGAQLARGYWGRPAETAERFVPDPWGAPGARMYRSGDLARWGRDGLLTFAGRRDGQVKIRGHRVELGEVEAVAREHAAVAEAAVELVGARGLVALVVWREADRTEELRDWLAGRLPAHMLPAAILGVERLPLTPNGKVDRGRLRELAAVPRDVAAGPPGTEEERTLAEIWRELLELDAVGVDEAFFDLGGNSLLAIEMLARVHGDLGVRLPPRVLFEAPTIADLASVVRRERTV